MSYSSIAEMVNSQSLRSRIVACVAQEGITNPEQWTASNMWKLAASPDWATDWEYAVNTATPNVNPDTGARNDVISDGDILAAVQAAQV